MNDEICGRVIKEAYLRVINKGVTPSAASTEQMVKDVVERNAYELLYADIDFGEITEEYIHHTLCATGCLHTYFGNTYFEAQNTMFKNWFPHLLLLEGD